MDIKYESPTVYVLQVEVEQGYNVSGSDDGGIVAPEWGVI